MAVSGKIIAQPATANEGPITHPTTTRSKSEVCIADATGTVYTAAQLLDPLNAYALSSAAACKVVDIGNKARVRFAARASTGYTAVSASPAIVVWAVDADDYDPVTGVFTNARSVERIDATAQAAAATALTFNGSPSTTTMVQADSMWITPYTSDMDAKGRRWIIVLLATKFAGTGSGTVDIIAEAIN